jgi:hypothetical protein
MLPEHQDPQIEDLILMEVAEEIEEVIKRLEEGSE